MLAALHNSQHRAAQREQKAYILRSISFALLPSLRLQEWVLGTLRVPPVFLMMCMLSRLLLPFSLSTASTASFAKCSLSCVRILELHHKELSPRAGLTYHAVQHEISRLRTCCHDADRHMIQRGADRRSCTTMKCFSPCVCT